MAAAKAKKARAKSRRKGHVQQQLFRRGGKRRGAGRKSKKVRPGRRHARRADFSARHPLHVVLRVEDAVGTLRRRAMYEAIREATISAAERQRIRIIHVSLQRNHIHMIVEAADREMLARGLQGFQIASARYINRALGRELERELRWAPWRIEPRNVGADADADASAGAAASAGADAGAVVVRGCAFRPWRGGRGRGHRRRGGLCRRGRVFADRYYVEVITSPTQAYRALNYVLNNWRRHRADQAGAARTWLVDPFSSGILFPHWRELANRDVMWPIRAGYEPMIVYLPMTWLLTDGWKRVGPISARSKPGPTSTPTATG